MLVASGSPATAAAPDAADGSSAVAYRGFDALATAEERNGTLWKHLGLIGDRYVIFDDTHIYEGPASIAGKWPFLPSRFTSNLDAASVVLERGVWKYMFTKGTERVIFFDWGLAIAPQHYPSVWPFLGPQLSNGINAITTHLEGNNLWVHLTAAGEYYAIHNDTQARSGPTLIRTRWPFLPQHFTSNLDDASYTIEQGYPKISFYKGTERIIFNDVQVIEHVNIVQKWPFLAGFLEG
ncbi:hypothetical protein [Saccharothrix obliqua]|uniref:hypothetical protein n=1 Tax=Saccharothrix obliqua TaxID=2861747 RepID=UPI001C5EA30A|nr:hypothetical protein [Saccharothrix obliqua]MBW4721560.1 hypothetical protein [Saccharothrix obliqua]